MPAPVRSMTGAGTFVHAAPEGRFEAEARSVNHRFLKVSWRAFGPLPELGIEVEDRVRHAVERGHVTLSVRLTPAAETKGTSVNREAFAAAASDLKALAQAAGLAPVTASDVLAVPGVLQAASRDESGATALTRAALAAVDGALQALNAARAREGAALAEECRALLAGVERASAALAARAGEVPAAWQQRLRARLETLLQGTGAAVDPQALAREVAAMAERSDVREELTRLAAHVAHARALLTEGGAVGRTLDFLVQEMNREANTVGSKANDLALTRTVIGLKADVERLREQVQNLE
jgi:uncharacterized protein (TIGR00255 family)